MSTQAVPRQTEKPSSAFPLSAQIAIAMALGLVLGPILGKSAGPLGEAAKLVIQIIKAVAAPLLSLAIVNAILKTEVGWRAGIRMLGFAMLNGTLALTLGVALSNLLRPGDTLRDAVAGGLSTPPDAAYAGKKIDFLKVLTGHVPDSTAKPFVENAVIGIVLLSLLFGFGMRRAKAEQIARGETAYLAVESGVTTLLSATEQVLGWVVRLVPIAVFAVVAKTVGEHGYAPFAGLGVYVAVGLLGLLLHVVFVYQFWMVFYGVGLRNFWRSAREPVIYAAGANSSLATLPLTLRALDRLKVSKSASTLGACVGTNLNNDGIILYEGMAVLFVAQASGLELALAQQLVIAAICMVAAMGVAGVPEAGFISLALVLNTVNLPIEVLPLLLSVDWVVARARSMTNVLSDMVLSILVDGRRSTRSTPEKTPA